MSAYLQAEVETRLINGGDICRPALCETCAATKLWARSRRLMTRDELEHYLALSREQVESLINTRQITTLQMKGERRFDSKDADLFIESYKQTAKRRA